MRSIVRYIFFLLLFRVFFYDSLSALNYQHLLTDQQQSIHILIVDPILYEVRPIKVPYIEGGREKVSTLVKNFHALAGINGGFFEMDGRPSGILKIDGQWYSLPVKPRGAIGWTKDGHTFLMDRVLVDAFLQLDDTIISIDGLNKPCKDHQTILYNCHYYPTANWEENSFLIKDSVIDAKQDGCRTLSCGEWVLSSGHKELASLFKVGKKVALHFNSIAQNSLSHQWDHLDHIVGGTPLLLSQGKKIEDFSEEKTLQSFIQKRYARTAVGLLPNGHLVFISTDWQDGKHEGLTIDELCDLMQRLGCYEAVNLDGGKSSIMVIGDKIMNQTQAELEEENVQSYEERKVSDAILIFRRDNSQHD